jgi:hypothetical protein
MTRTSLSDLYRRFTQADAPKAHAVEADDLAAAAEGSLAADRREAVAGVLASSPAHASLLRVLRDLKSDSATLASGIADSECDTAHRRRHATGTRRIATHRRSGASRWAALAACLVAVIGAWSVHHSRSGSGDMQSGARSTLARADTIFSTHDRIFGGDDIFGGGMDKKSRHADGKPHASGDRVFHGDFSGG